MLRIEELHNAAMRFAEDALVAKRRGSQIDTRALYRRAMKLEAQAANTLLGDFDQEPTRSILYRSASNLALLCEDYAEAERLASRGLSGYPPPEILEELREAHETATFHTHLSMRGRHLSTAEMRLMITGRSVGYGVVMENEFTYRLGYVKRACQRTDERLRKLPFQTKDRPSRSKLPVALYAPEAGCFAITLRLCSDVAQLGLPHADPGTQVIDEVMECFRLVNEEKIKDLQDRITSTEYFNNFVVLAQNIAPDGQEVKAVALSALNMSTNTPRHVEFHNTRERIMDVIAAHQVPVTPEQDTPPTEVLIGTLLEADGIKSSIVSIVDDIGKTHRISVPRELLDDHVKGLWGERVIARVDDTRRQRKRFILKSMIRDIPRA